MAEKIRPTRKQTEIFLVGQPINSIAGFKLPTNKDVLQYFFGIKSARQSTAPKSEDIAYETIDNVTIFWNMARIKVKTRRYCKDQLIRLFKHWDLLKKHINRETKTEEANRETFKTELTQLFDISAPDAVDEISRDLLLTKEQKEQDINFYLDQKGERIGHMSGNDKIFTQKIERRERKRAIEEDRRRKEEDRVNFPSVAGCSHEMFESESGNDSSTSNNEPIFQPQKKPGLKEHFVTLSLPKKIMESAEIVAAFDRVGLSDQQSLIVTSAIIKAGSGNLDDFSLSHSTTRRARMKIRQSIAEEAAQHMRENPPSYGALHWDGKLIKDIFGERHEYLAILISGSPHYLEGKILGIPKTEGSTGQIQADTAFELLHSWHLQNNIVSLVFDTTASNTGKYKGAARLLEGKLDKKLYYIACRHHVLELIVGAAWESVFGSSLAPGNKLFAEFKDAWKDLDKSSEVSPIQINNERLIQIRSTSVKFLRSIDMKKVLRNDYKECVVNSLILLGEKKATGKNLARPGAISEARWMAKLLYANKMLMLANQMGYDKEMIDRLEKINTFFCVFYVPMWMKATFATEASANDLHFIKSMIEYKTIEPVIADAALNKMMNHRWYLTSELIPFALFATNEMVPPSMKQLLAKKIYSQEEPEIYRCGKPVFPTVSAQSVLLDFVGPESLYFFKTLDLSKDWLQQPFGLWPKYQDYRKAKEFVTSLKVVNDAAERGIKLITDFANKITTDKEQQNWLLQTVEAHRHNIDTSRKSSLKKTFSLHS